MYHVGMKMTLAHLIKERMKAKDLSVAELERKAGLKMSAVRNILRGQSKKPSAETLQAIAEVLDCSIVELMGFSEKEKSDFPQMKGRSFSDPLIEDFDLIREACVAINQIIKDKNIDVSIDHYLEILKNVYLYALREKTHKVDRTFAEWFIENKTHQYF